MQNFHVVLTDPFKCFNDVTQMVGHLFGDKENAMHMVGHELDAHITDLRVMFGDVVPMLDNAIA